jgi:hypothetical protein
VTPREDRHEEAREMKTPRKNWRGWVGVEWTVVVTIGCDQFD